MEKLVSVLSGCDMNVLIDIVSRIGHGALSGQELAQTAISAVTLILGGLLLKALFKGYRVNFRFSKNPFFFGTRKAVDAGGFYSFLTLPIGLIEACLSPLYLALAMFTPRDEHDKAQMKSKLVSVKDLAKELESLKRELVRTKRKVNVHNEKISRVEDSREKTDQMAAQLSSLLTPRRTAGRGVKIQKQYRGIGRDGSSIY
jgi:hypothetical protein